jgi:hypothetical protein
MHDDQVVEMYMALSLRLMHEGVSPQLIARVALGNAVHMFMEHHEGGLRAARDYLQEKVRELDALIDPPPAAIN